MEWKTAAEPGPLLILARVLKQVEGSDGREASNFHETIVCGARETLIRVQVQSATYRGTQKDAVSA